MIDFLVVLVSLSGDKEPVSGPACGKCHADCLCAVGFFAPLASGWHSGTHVRQDCEGVLRPGIVAGNPDEIRLCGRLRHHGPFSPVPVASASEEDSEPSRALLAEGVERAGDFLRRMRVVHEGDCTVGAFDSL